VSQFNNMLSGVFPHEVLKNQFKDYLRPNDKISYEISKGSLIKLRKGWYTKQESLEQEEYLKFNAANLIYGPSYISLFSALEYWQLIPEIVRITESVTLKRMINVKTPIGTFKYRNVPENVFSLGIKPVRIGDLSFLIANPAKALCDIIWTTSNIQLRSQKEARTFLIEDLRIDEEELYRFDLETLNKCVERGRKKESLRQILKIIKGAE